MFETAFNTLICYLTVHEALACVLSHLEWGRGHTCCEANELGAENAKGRELMLRVVKSNFKNVID